MTGPPHDDLDDVLEHLGRAPRAPDLTGRVMRRLGFRRAGIAAARRSRLVRRLARLAAAAVVAGACVALAWLGTRDPQPAGPTLPSAIRNDLSQHGRTLDAALGTIRDLASGPAAAPGPAPDA